MSEPTVAELQDVISDLDEQVERLQQERDEAHAEVVRLKQILCGMTQAPCEPVDEEK